MTRKMIAASLTATLLLFTLTGCWDRKELNELGIVVAIGIDKENATGNFLLTSQVVRPGALKTQQGGSTDKSPYEIVVTKGSSIFEAVRNTVREFDRKSFFSHIKVIVVSEPIARENMTEIIDFVSRTHEIRKIAWLMVARGAGAGKVLGVKRGIENLQATYMEGIIKRQDVNLQTTTSGVIDFIKKMPGEGINPITGVFNIVSAKEASPEGKGTEVGEALTLTGTAAYKKGKLIGFLNNEDTIGLNLITGNVRIGVVQIPALEDKNKKLSIEIKKVNSNIKSEIVGGRIHINIHLKVSGNITEVEDTTDVSKPDVIESINREFRDFVKTNAEMTVRKVQQELQTDILGFGSTFQKEFPSEWKNYAKEKWDTLFPDLDCSINVDGSVKQTGLLIKPLSISGD